MEALYQTAASRDPAAAATSANLPQKAAHTATGGASGRNRSRSPGMGPDVGLRGARRRPHGGLVLSNGSPLAVGFPVECVAVPARQTD